MSATTVLVLMSGGVDSGVAAALLRERGFKVIGVTMRQITSSDGIVATSGCCSYGDMRDAKRVAWSLEIDHYTLDTEKAFRQRVIQPFLDDYIAGRTPNPCVSCNRDVRFDEAFEMADQLGADLVATGHYARLDHDGSTGRPVLKRAVDRSKDQSYFLYGIREEFLRRMLLPIGDYPKTEVREMAGRYDLPIASKPDSQDICFTLEGNVHDFLASRGSDSEGKIVDTNGKTLGTHRGVSHYTVGQRQGLGLADGPWYVMALDPDTNRVIAGRREELAQQCVRAGHVNLLGELQVGDHLDGMIRSQMSPRPCQVESVDDETLTVHFDEPLYGVAPGQSLVLYCGDAVVGGGIIRSREPVRVETCE